VHGVPVTLKPEEVERLKAVLDAQTEGPGAQVDCLLK